METLKKYWYIVLGVVLVLWYTMKGKKTTRRRKTRRTMRSRMRRRMPLRRMRSRMRRRMPLRRMRRRMRRY
jgi:hypothetical protein